jgi:hypothetical protein
MTMATDTATERRRKREAEGSGSGDPVPRARRSVVLKILILVGALTLIGGVVCVTAGGVFRRLNPDLALRFMPFDARANAAAANQLVMKNGTRMLDPARDQAVRALARDPTAVDAVATLGMIASFQGRNDLADRRFGYAERVSRRDVPSQLWFIERRVQANDIEGALHHYNIALSTSLATRQQLTPILIAAASNAGIAGPLRNLLRAKPIWRDNFFERFVAEGMDARALVAMTSGLLDARTQPDRNYLNVLMIRLLQMHAYAEAWEAWRVATRERAASATALRDGQFRVDDGLPPFHWIYSVEPGLIPERRPRADAAAGFALYLPASARDGEVARQLLHLGPGRHEIAADVGDTGSDPDLRPRLSLRCATEAGEMLLDLPLPQAPTGGGAMRALVSVPGNCPFQWVAIRVRGDMDNSGSGEPWISSIRIG